jgi:hypothetical protein
MSITELLDDDTFDPEKLFNEKNFRTLVIDRNGFSKKENNTADIVSELLDKNITRQESEEIFARLKEMKAQAILIQSINAAEDAEDQAKLVAACWESGLDFSDHFQFFVSLANSRDYRIAMEALTVVENCEGKIPEKILRDCIDSVNVNNSGTTSITAELLNHLKKRLADEQAT